MRKGEWQEAKGKKYFLFRRFFCRQNIFRILVLLSNVVDYLVLQNRLLKKTNSIPKNQKLCVATNNPTSQNKQEMRGTYIFQQPSIVGTENFGISIKYGPTGSATLENDAQPWNLNGNNYARLPHDVDYQFVLTNENSTECDMIVDVDGKNIGTFRVGPLNSIKIRRPANLNRQFHFVKEQSTEAAQAGVQSGKTENGLVKVTFRPRKQRPVYQQWGGLRGSGDYFSTEDSTESDMDTSFGQRRIIRKSLNSGRRGRDSEPAAQGMTLERGNLSSGATTLGQQTGQNFIEVPDIRDDEVDQSKAATVMFRLVHDDALDSFNKPVALGNID
jgi:hypothetical protein